MSGDLESTRAKYFRHFHTSHKTLYDGSEIQHPKGNLTASVDGDYDIKADAIDFNHTPVLNVKNVLRTVKTTVAPPFTGLASQSFPLFRASPGDTVYDQYANVTIGLASGGVRKGTKMEAGDAGDVDGFGKSISASPIGWKWISSAPQYAKGEYIFNASPFYREHKTYAIGTLILAKITASDLLLASLGAGSIDFYVDVMSRD